MMYIGKWRDELVYIGFPGSLDNLCHRNLSWVIPVRYVLSDTAVKQYWFLGHDSDLFTEPLDI